MSRIRPRKLRGVLGMYERTQAELSKLLGSKSRSSELMLGKRYLNKHQIRLLNEEWGIDLGQLFAASFPPEPPKLSKEENDRVQSALMRDKIAGIRMDQGDFDGAMEALKDA